MDITLEDLEVMRNIIDACVKRGAFEGSEMLPVGVIREKISSVIQQYELGEESKEDNRELLAEKDDIEITD